MYWGKYLKKFKKKKKFFLIFLKNFFGLVIIWTVHLDVQTLCGCGHFWGNCVVCGQQPQQQLLSTHCCGAVTAYNKMKSSLLITQKLICFFIFKHYFYHTLQKRETGLLFTQNWFAFHFLKFLIIILDKSKK